MNQRKMIRSTFMERYRRHIMDIMKKRRDEYDGNFLLVTQNEWEKDVIWDTENVTDKQKSTSSVCWIPTLYSRKEPCATSSKPPENENNATLFKIIEEEPGTQIAFEGNKAAKNKPPKRAISFLPIENPDLALYRWEDDIIWDAEEEDPETWRDLIPCFDASDENIVLHIPADSVDVADGVSANKLTNKTAKPKANPHTSTSKKLIAEIFGDPNTSAENEVEMKLDPYNISNDEYYKLGSSQMSLSTFSNRQQFLHTKPVGDFHPLLFPATQFHYYALRGYHRPSVRRLLTAQKIYSIQAVHKFAAQLKKKNESKLKKEEKMKRMGEPVPKSFSPFDSILELTGRCGEIILVEYCEQFPPLLSQVGMHSKITNYVQKIRKVIDLNMKYGEFVTARENTFLGQLGKDTVLQSLENNLYRCPIYEHPVKSDFLVIRVGNNLFVREIDALFTAGQQSPMAIVPQPKSKASTAFTKNFLKITICRFLRNSKNIPKTVHMAEIKAAFPNVSENSIRKILSDLAEYHRGGQSGTWKMKSSPHFSLPSESELASLITPEQYCAHYSSESAELRLKMLGYSEKHFLSRLKVGEGNNEEFETHKMEEVNCAPWNTTRAFMSSVKGSCLLDVNGPADPTGCGEGFSYIRTSNKAITVAPEQKKCINGSKVDLRKLGVIEAKKLLKSFGVAESQYKKLSRWEMIDVIKTLSSEKTIDGEKALGFSRVNPLSMVERQKKNRRDRQHIFDLQNRVLASDEILSSDENGEDSDVSDIEEAGKQLEEMLTKNVSQEQVDLECEERERSSLIKMLMEEKKVVGEPSDNKDVKKKRVLKISRTYNTPDGRTYIMTETVRNQQVIDIYEKIQKMGGKAEQLLKSGTLKRGADRLKANEKRLEVDRARRQKRKEQKELKRMGDEAYSKNAPKKTKGKLLPGFDKKCGACKQVGHLRTNSCCPQFVPKKKTERKRKGRRPNLGVTVSKMAKKEVPLSSHLPSYLPSDTDSDSDSEC